jgi:sulfur carrier protein ThiS
MNATDEQTRKVTLTVFGDRRYTTTWPGTHMTVAEVLARHNVDVGGRRLAKNGHLVAADAVVVPGDELTIVPRVQGG